MTAGRRDPHAPPGAGGGPAGRWLLLSLALGACSNLSGDSDTPILLEIRAPSGVGGGSPVVEISDTFQLSARALNQDGDSVAATFAWRTPDTANLFVEPLTGRISGKKAGPARVQVSSGSLTSDFVNFTVVPAAESLQIVPPDSARVLVTDTASVPLVAELDTLNPLGPLQGRQILYQLTTIFGQPGDTASLGGGGMTRAVATNALGQPTSPVYVRVIPALARPDSVLVEVTAFRPSGAAIPGSGQVFIVRFD
jgi:hypothetical protein